MTNTTVAIIMLHYGTLQNTQSAITSLFSHFNNFALFLVNNTHEDLAPLKKKYPTLTLLNPSQNLGFSAGVNLGIKSAQKRKYQYVLLLNNDIQILQGTLMQLLKTLNSAPDIGVVAPLLKHALGYDWGAKLSKWSGLLKHTNFPNPPKTTITVSHLAAAAILLPMRVIEKVGYFDERYFMYYEDVDYFLRLTRAGYKALITPELIVEHMTSNSTILSQRTFYQWQSHFKFITKFLFNPFMPTAYIISVFWYPLIYLKTLIFPK